ncbi:hypothetical protein OIU84_018600 [Salix udensis]|uniref:non-specific serine/threonine protein kinase n=1 Tax=Salix udensis TaxID=889485 RepID=A0AAD6KWX2_9ROSI|nr:hypothetical protein OIU84_018600 [Salix udensis]
MTQSSKNILGRGGFGIVYKGCLNDGTLVAVKRLKDCNIAGGEIQFQTEVETISLAIHRNLLRLSGFCSTENERLLVYPYMPNGSVASQLRDHIHGRAALDWARRKRIALAVRGTVGHIAPEYLSTGQSSEKTDVFGFGILLLELITGQKALDFGRAANQKGVMLDWTFRIWDTSNWSVLRLHIPHFHLLVQQLISTLYLLLMVHQVKKLHHDRKLNLMVDKDLRSNFDRIELEEMVQVALLCTQFNPSHRPKMSEVLKMLEGDGLAEKWEASQRAETPRIRSCENHPQRYSDYIEESSLVVEAMELSGPR